VNAVKAYDPLTNTLYIPDPAKEISGMVRQLCDMSNTLEIIERNLKAVSEVCDWDSYLYNAYEDIGKLNSRLISVMEQLQSEVR